MELFFILAGVFLLTFLVYMLVRTVRENNSISKENKKLVQEQKELSKISKELEKDNDK